MKRILSLALIIFALLRTGIVDIPERATAWIGEWSVAGISAAWRNEQGGGKAPGVADAVIYRVPIREPDGAFLKKLLDLFEIDSES